MAIAALTPTSGGTPNSLTNTSMAASLSGTTADGNTLNIITIAGTNGTATNMVITAPAGWTPFGTAVNDGASPALTYSSYYRIYQSGDTVTPTFTIDGTGGNARYVCDGYSGVDGTTPITNAIQSAYTGTNTAKTTDSITTSADGWIFWAYGDRTGGVYSAVTGPGTPTARGTSQNPSSSTVACFDSNGIVTAGSGKQSTATGPSTSVGGSSIARINPAPAGAASGSGSVSIAGTGAASSASTGTASISIAGTGIASSPEGGLGAISVSGSGTARAGVSGTGAISLAGTGGPTGASGLAGTGSVTILGTGATATGALATWLLKPGKRFCGHRDGFYGSPWNLGEFTLEGFTALKNWNPDVAWNLDVHKTTDNFWILSHDPTTGRVLSGTSLDITANTYASVSSKTTLVGGNLVRTIDEAVAIAPANTIFFVENKSGLNTTAFFDKLAALGLTPQNTVIKAYISAAVTFNEANTRGYTSWAYIFDADMAAAATYHSLATWLGFDYTGTQANWDTLMAYGQPMFAHILPNLAAQATADAKAANTGGSNFGYMVSGVSNIVPAVAGGSGLISIGGTGAGKAPSGGSGSISIGGTGTARGGATGTASISIAGTGTASTAATATGTGSIGISGSGSTIPAGGGAAAISVAGSGTTLAGAAGTGAVSIAGSGTASSAGTLTGGGSISIIASAVAIGQATASGSIAIVGNGGAGGYTPTSGAGGISIVGGGTGKAFGGQGSIQITGYATVSGYSEHGADPFYLSTQSMLTDAYIAESPVYVTLIPSVRTRTVTGGYTQSPGAPRLPQTMRIIETSSIAVTDPTRAETGFQRVRQYQLMASVSAVMEVGDTFIHDSRVWTIISMMPYNGYERRAVVDRVGH